MSHIYSFAVVNFLVYHWISYLQKHSMKHIICMAIAFGLIILIRPINVLTVFILPLFYQGNPRDLLKLISFKKVFFIVAVAAAICTMQLIIYKIQTGNFLIYSYQNEAFIWSRPKMNDILFSYRKGLFLYTPLLLLSLSGLVLLWKKNSGKTIYWIIFFVGITYIFSCWWAWAYGGGFSGRTYIEYMIIFALPLCYVIQWSLKSKWKYAVFTLIGFFIILNQTQIYQYRYGIIHWSETTKEMYWDNFMRVDKLITDSK